MAMRFMEISLLGWECETEADEPLVGHGLRVCPRPLADLVLQALHRELALDGAHAGGLGHGEGRDHLLARALDGERAARLELAAAQRLHRRGDELRFREALDVEPYPSPRLGLALVAV